MFSLSVEVGYVPVSATCALQISESGALYGPYPATPSLGTDTKYSLSISLPSAPVGLTAGTVSVQPGDVVAGTFTPDGPPIPGTEASTLAAGGLDWDVILGSPLVDIAEETSVLSAQATQPVHVKWTAGDNLLESPVTLTGNASVTAVEMAIVHGAPLAADWQPATLVTRTVGDVTDGEYSVLLVGPGQALLLTDATWHVWGRLTTTGEVIALCAPGYLSVQN